MTPAVISSLVFATFCSLGHSHSLHCTGCIPDNPRSNPPGARSARPNYSGPSLSFAARELLARWWAPKKMRYLKAKPVLTSRQLSSVSEVKLGVHSGWSYSSKQKIELPIMGLLDLEGLFFFKQFLERLLSCLKALGSNTPYTYQHSMWHFLLEQSDSRLCDVIHVGRKNIATDNVRKSGREDEVECANLRVFSIWVLALGLILTRRSWMKVEKKLQLTTWRK